MLGKQCPFKDVRCKLDTHLHSHSVGKNRVISSCKGGWQVQHLSEAVHLDRTGLVSKEERENGR